MIDKINPAATDHLPSFITAPGQTDVLMVVMAIILLIAVMGLGVFFLRLHTLPERIAHRTSKVQFEIVAILGLIALFTHQHIFWIAGLLLAFIELPDFGTSLNRIAASAETIAGIKPAESTGGPQEIGAHEQEGEAPGADVQGGTIKAYLFEGERRSPILPEVPTAKEAGLPEFRVSAWVALFAPRETPKSVLDKITDALDKALDDQNVRKRMGELANEIPDRASRGQQPLAALVRADIARWERIIKTE